MARSKKAKRMEEEIPKSVLKMKKDKEKREKEEAKKNSKNKKEIRNKKKIFKKIILFLFFILLITISIALGVSAYNWKKLAVEMFNNEHSVVVDTDGNVIAELGNEQKKIVVDYEDIPDNLINAYVSIEDERYYTHHGVDIKRTASAIFSYIVNLGKSSYGGSTITQQLVKNITGDNTDSVTRKVKEWWKAFLLETYFTKEEILEMYLNIIYVGPNIYGVQTGAKYYFDKDVSELSLAECAYLAGINNSPNSYNPFGELDNDELIENRTITVLQKMLELEYITQSQYDTAVEEVKSGLNFNQGEIKTGDVIYSYHTDALITQIISDLSEDMGISEEFAKNYLYMSGSTIHSTQDSEIQDRVEYEFNKNQYILYSSDGESTAQAAMVIIDHETGNVIACAGGLGEKTTFRGLNRATQSLRQTGSSIKPLAVLIPGIDKKQFTASTIYSDEKVTFSDEYSPRNNNDVYLGSITVRRALESSQNIPFVEMMEEITPSKAIQYLENMGITSLTSEDNNLALSLGGLEKGITPLEMAGAYATIANDGVYIEPTFYTEVTSSKGETIYTVSQQTKKVFSEQVAYVVKELLKEPVEGTYGTATYCRISGIDVAAKTGTTDENYDKWLCGFTPYYTAVTWYGFDQNETIKYNNQNPAGIIWSNVMRSIHSDLADKTFEQPSWITTKIICEDTGMVARTGCSNTYTEYFLWGTAPNECNRHSGSVVSSSSSSSSTNSTNILDDDTEIELDPTDQTPDTIIENVEENNDVTSQNTIDDTISQNTINTQPENVTNDVVVNDTVVNNTTIDNESQTNTSINENTTQGETGEENVNTPETGGEQTNTTTDSTTETIPDEDVA